MKFLRLTKRELIAAIVGWGAGYLVLALVAGGYFYFRAEALETTDCDRSAPSISEGLRAWVFKGPSAVYLCVRLIKNGQPVNLASYNEVNVTGTTHYRLKDGTEVNGKLGSPESFRGWFWYPMSQWDQYLEGSPVDIVLIVTLNSGEAYTTHVQFTPPFTPFLAYPD
jgi:hypothetical protein